MQPSENQFEKGFKRCENCHFFVPYTYDFSGKEVPCSYGECHRYPPRAVPEGECGFPVVIETSWCGEFRI